MVVRSGRESLREAARNDFFLFLPIAFAILNPGQNLSPAWYLEALCYELAEVEAGNVRRLVVNIPPRHLKSTTISVAWVAWCLGRNPALRFMCISYSETLAADLGRACRTVMEHQVYRRLFPGTVLTKRSELHLETTQGGHRIGSSISGSNTGRGADCVILDDPIDANDAQSEVMRDKVDELYRNTIVPRPNDPNSAAFIVVQQRLHEDDLTGRLLKRSDWRPLVISAIAQEHETHRIGRSATYQRRKGEVLDPARMSEATLAERRKDMGPQHFSAQYLQAPLPDQGSIIMRSWIRSAPMMQREPGDLVIQSWDTAVKTGRENDYSACVTAIVRNNIIYVASAMRGKFDFPELYQQIASSAYYSRPDALLIEDHSSGQSMLQHIAQSTLPFNIEPTAIRFPGSKEERAARASVHMHRGGFYICEECVGSDDLMRELLAFPSGKNDDLVDASVNLILYVAEHRLMDPTPLEALRISPWFGVSERPDDEPWDPNEIDVADM